MREYSKISPGFWTGETGRGYLRGCPESWTVAFYLVTGPMSSELGLYYLPLLYIQHDTGIPLKGAWKGLQRCFEGGFCSYDRETETVWVHEMAAWQIGHALKASDNRVKHVNRLYRNAPKSPFLKPFFDRYGNVFHLEEARIFEGASKPLASPFEANNKSNSIKVKDNTSSNEEESPGKPDDEPSFPHVLAEDEQSPTLAPMNPQRPAPKRGAPPCPHQEIIALYHRLLPELPAVRDWGDARKKLLRGRWAEKDERQDVSWWELFFLERVKRVPFLLGDNDRGWRANLEWLLKPKNFAKVLEGAYGDRNSGGAPEWRPPEERA